MIAHLLAAGLLLSSTLPVEEKRVVASIPDLADIAERLGGERIAIKTIARPGQNLHAVRVKPSHLVAVSRADVFLQVGLSLEHAWVPGLLEAARNRDVLPGGEGFVNAGEGFAAIDIPQKLDRSESVDVHPEGNPHINQSIAGGLHLAERVLAGLIRNDPSGEQEYRAGFTGWLSEYEAYRARWEVLAAAVKATEKSVVVYHREFDYLLRDLGLTVAASLEPKPGVAPTAKHLAKVVERCKEEPVCAILTAGWSNNSSVARVAKLTDLPVLEMPLVVGEGEGNESWIAMIDQSITRLARAAGVNPEAVLVEHRLRQQQKDSEGDASRRTALR